MFVMTSGDVCLPCPINVCVFDVLDFNSNCPDGPDPGLRLPPREPCDVRFLLRSVLGTLHERLLFYTFILRQCCCRVVAFGRSESICRLCPLVISHLIDEDKYLHHKVEGQQTVRSASIVAASQVRTIYHKAVCRTAFAFVCIVTSLAVPHHLLFASNYDQPTHQPMF